MKPRNDSPIISTQRVENYIAKQSTSCSINAKGPKTALLNLQVSRGIGSYVACKMGTRDPTISGFADPTFPNSFQRPFDRPDAQFLSSREIDVQGTVIDAEFRCSIPAH